MPNIPIGLFFNIWESLKNKFTKYLFQKVYMVSNQYYWNNKYLGWKTFASYFQYQIFFPYNFEIDKNNFCYFRIKSLDPKKFSKIKFSLTAFSSYGGNKFQEVIELYDLESRPFEVTLPNIPPKGFIIDLLPLYDTLIIEIHELYDYNNLNLNQVSYKLKERYTIFHSEILNDEFERHWEKVWHVGLIKQVKANLIRKYAWYLSYNRLFYFNQSFLAKIRRFFTHPVYLFLTTEIILSIIFWSKNLINAKKLRAIADVKLKEYN